MLLFYAFVLDWLPYCYFYSFYKCIDVDGNEGRTKELKTPPIFKTTGTLSYISNSFLYLSISATIFRIKIVENHTYKRF